MSMGRYLFYAQRGKCHYCNAQMERTQRGKQSTGRLFCTEDHIIPKSQGGGDMIGNKVGACNACNNMRGTIPYTEFKQYIQIHGNETSIRLVLKSLTYDQYLKHKPMYDVVRWHHFQSHLSFDQKDMMPPLHARRPYLNETRRRLRRKEEYHDYSGTE